MLVAVSDDQKHFYETIVHDAQTTTKRTLMCKAKNADGVVDDRYIFNVISKNFLFLTVRVRL